MNNGWTPQSLQVNVVPEILGEIGLGIWFAAKYTILKPSRVAKCRKFQWNDNVLQQQYQDKNRLHMLVLPKEGYQMPRFELAGLRPLGRAATRKPFLQFVLQHPLHEFH